MPHPSFRREEETDVAAAEEKSLAGDLGRDERSGPTGRALRRLKRPSPSPRAADKLHPTTMT